MLYVGSVTQVAVLALEAGKTLLLDKDELLRLADEAGLSIVGVEPAASS